MRKWLIEFEIAEARDDRVQDKAFRQCINQLSFDTEYYWQISITEQIRKKENETAAHAYKSTTFDWSKVVRKGFCLVFGFFGEYCKNCSSVLSLVFQFFDCFSIYAWRKTCKELKYLFINRNETAKKIGGEAIAKYITPLAVTMQTHAHILQKHVEMMIELRVQFMISFAIESKSAVYVIISKISNIRHPRISRRI